MITYKVISPIYLTTGVKKIRKNALNLNEYLHWHFQHYNKLKKVYKEAIREQLADIKVSKVIVEYIFYAARKGCDRNNFLAVVDKFFMDALVECKCLKNDTDKFVIETKFSGDIVDSKHPRCEIFIYDIEL